MQLLTYGQTRIPIQININILIPTTSNKLQPRYPCLGLKFLLSSLEPCQSKTTENPTMCMQQLKCSNKKTAPDLSSFCMYVEIRGLYVLFRSSASKRPSAAFANANTIREREKYGANWPFLRQDMYNATYTLWYGCRSRVVFVCWAHGHVPTQYFEIYVAVHPISDVPVNCVPTQYLAPRYGTDVLLRSINSQSQE